MQPAERRGNSWIMHQGSGCHTWSGETYRYVWEDSIWDKPLSYCVTCFRLHFITCNVFLCHNKSLMLSPFPELHLFTASSQLCLMSSWANRATMRGLKRWGNTRAAAFCTCFWGNWVNKGSNEIWFFLLVWRQSLWQGRGKSKGLLLFCQIFSLHAQSLRNESRLKQTLPLVVRFVNFKIIFNFLSSRKAN